MKRFLLISYNFPPYWSTGTVRVAKLAKYLPAEGWKPEVVTCTRHYYGPGLRIEMTDYEGLTIYRTPFNILEYAETAKQTLRSWVLRLRPKKVSAPEKKSPTVADAIPARQSIYTFKPMERFLRWICPIETFVLWMPASFLYGAWLLFRERDLTLIFATGAPYTQLITAAVLTRLFPRTRLVVDFRDAWVEDENRYYPTRLHRWFEYRMERFVVESASRVTLVSDEVLPFFIQKYGHPEKFVYIPNGYDPDDFKDIATREPDHRVFTLNHFGGIGSGRNISGLLRAIKQLADRGAIARGQFKANFYGGVDRFFLREIEAMNLHDFVVVHDRIPYRQGIETMAQTSVLLLVVDADPSTSSYPTKFFEYLNARRPILLVGPERGAAKFILEHRIGQCVPEDDVAGLANAIQSYYERGIRGELPSHSAPIEQFSRKTIAKSMAAAFNSL